MNEHLQLPSLEEVEDAYLLLLETVPIAIEFFVKNGAEKAASAHWDFWCALQRVLTHLERRDIDNVTFWIEEILHQQSPFSARADQISQLIATRESKPKPQPKGDTEA